MKRILLILPALLILLTLSVHAQSGSLSVTAAGSGDNVTVTVRLDNPGIIATRIFVHYDSQVLQLTAAENGEVFPSGNTTFGRDLSADPYTMLWDESLRRDNNTTSGTLCTLTFAVIGGSADGTTNVEIAVDQNSTFNVDLHPVTVADGACSVSVPVNETETPAGKVRSVTADDLALHYKDVGTIRPVVTADDGVRYTVTYSGFDEKIVSVDKDGNVTALKKGAANVTVSVTDEYGNTQECTCKVTVTYTWLQILIRIFLLGFLWY